LEFLDLADGSRVRFEVRGPQAGPTVLFLCGVTVSCETFDRNFQALSDAGARCIRFDYPGRGWSSARAGFVGTPQSFSEVALAVLDALGIAEPTGLVGLSLGGAVAATLATNHPDRISRVAFVDPLFFTPRLTLSQKLLLIPGVGEIIFALRGESILVQGQIQDFFSHGSAEEFLPVYRRSIAVPGVTRSILATYRTLAGSNVERTFDALAATKHPLLLFWGREDQTVPFSRHDELVSKLGRAQLVVVDGAGHVPQWEKPEVVNPRLAEFFLGL
jgi:pimeloyl-ACP methyl ester carboxylesterase